MTDSEWIEVTPCWNNFIKVGQTVSITPDKSRVRVIDSLSGTHNTLLVIDGNILLPIAESAEYVLGKLK